MQKTLKIEFTGLKGTSVSPSPRLMKHPGRGKSKDVRTGHPLHPQSPPPHIQAPPQMHTHTPTLMCTHTDTHTRSHVHPPHTHREEGDLLCQKARSSGRGAHEGNGRTEYEQNTLYACMQLLKIKRKIISINAPIPQSRKGVFPG